MYYYKMNVLQLSKHTLDSLYSANRNPAYFINKFSITIYSGIMVLTVQYMKLVDQIRSVLSINSSIWLLYSH